MEEKKYSKFAIIHPLFTNIHARDSRYIHFARRNEAGRQQYLEEVKETLYQLYNSVCIAMWVPFNEGWGQFDSTEIMERILALDTTRHIDPASGWCDQGKGEISSKHVYFRKYRYRKDRRKRATIVSEFGGLLCVIEGHHGAYKEFGYRKAETIEELEELYINMMEEEIVPATRKGLSAFIYTQLSDVEGECNGLITFDRKIEKMSREKLKTLHDSIGIEE